MKQKLKRFLITCALLLVLINITSCGTPEGNALGALFCELTGGVWVMEKEFLSGGDCVRDQNAQEVTSKELDNQKIPLEEKELDKELEANNSVEEFKEGEIPPLSLEECYASADEFVLEVINLSKESGSRGVYCHGDYSVKNLSNYKMRVIWRSHLYTGEEGMEQLEYTRPVSIAAGSILTREFDHTTFTDGKETFHLATAMIVFYDLEECNLAVPDNLNKSMFIEIPDPCK